MYDDINNNYFTGLSALYWAAKNGQTESLKTLLRQPDINVNIGEIEGKYLFYR